MRPSLQRMRTEYKNLEKLEEKKEDITRLSPLASANVKRFDEFSDNRDEENDGEYQPMDDEEFQPLLR